MYLEEYQFLKLPLINEGPLKCNKIIRCFFTFTKLLSYSPRLYKFGKFSSEVLVYSNFKDLSK